MSLSIDNGPCATKARCYSACPTTSITDRNSLLRKSPSWNRRVDIADCAITYLRERSVDPRALVAAALKAARHREVDISSGTAVKEVLISGGRAAGVATDRTRDHAPVVVNCAGAWSGQIPPFRFPTRPVKGQMLAIVEGVKLNHVIRSSDVYLVPRSDGRIVVGATVEEAGYDKRTNARRRFERLHHAAHSVWFRRLHEGVCSKPGQACGRGLPTIYPSLARPEHLDISSPLDIFAMAFCWRQSPRRSCRS